MQRGPDRSTVLGWVLTLLLVSAAVFAGYGVARSFNNDFFEFSPDGGVAQYNASDGPRIEIDKSYSLRGGNPFTARSVNISTETNGYVNFSAPQGNAGSQPRGNLDEINGTWTNVSSLSVNNANLTINPSDKHAVGVGGGVTEVQFQDVNVNDTETDLIYSSSGTATIIVRNATPDTQFALIDQSTEEALDLGIADSNGKVVFDEAPSASSEAVRVEKAATLTFREEDEPHDLITGANVSIKLFERQDISDPTIVTREDTDGDGRIPVDALPVDEEFVVLVNTPGYHNDTVLIDDIGSQNQVFVLDKNGSSVENTFTITDRTGQFSPGGQEAGSVEVVIEHAINTSEYGADDTGYQWKTIGGDTLGADESYTVDLRFEDRYRIRVRNDEGQERILGAYQAELSGVVDLQISRLSFGVSADDDDWLFDTAYRNSSTAGSGKKVVFNYSDPTMNTSEVDVIIHEKGNESNEILNDTFLGPYGNLSVTQDVPAGENNTNWVVDWAAERNGETVSDQAFTGPQTTIASDLDPFWRQIASVLVILMVIFLFSRINAGVGAVVTSIVAGMLWQINWLASSTSAAAIVISLGVGLWLMYSRGQPVR